MNKVEKLQGLRHFLAKYGLPPERQPISLGGTRVDQALGGGLMPGALHEVFAQDWGAGGFAVCLAIRTAGTKPLFWVRPDYEGLEYGALHAQGIRELGGHPENLFLIKTANAAETLSAASDILSCPHVGALLLEISGQPRALDLVAGRKLNFLAGETGVTPILLREGAEAQPSAALTRWHVSSSPSQGDDWGLPSFTVELSRNRIGPTGRFHLTWNPDDGLFHELAREQFAPNPGRMATASFDRPVEKERRFAI